MQRIDASYDFLTFLDHLDRQTRDLLFKMIGEIYGSKVNHSPITARILRLKSLRWKLVSILFDCTLQLWLTAHYKVLWGSGRVLSGPSRISPKYREHAKLLDEIPDLTAHLWKRDSPKSWQRMHSLGMKTVFGIEMTEVRDAGLSLKRRGKCGIMNRLPRQTPFCIQLCGQVVIRSQSQNRLTGNTCFWIIAVWFL